MLKKAKSQRLLGFWPALESFQLNDFKQNRTSPIIKGFLPQCRGAELPV